MADGGAPAAGSVVFAEGDMGGNLKTQHQHFVGLRLKELKGSGMSTQDRMREANRLWRESRPGLMGKHLKEEKGKEGTPQEKFKKASDETVKDMKKLKKSKK